MTGRASSSFTGTSELPDASKLLVLVQLETMKTLIYRVTVVMAIVVFGSLLASGYSVLTHEEIVDLLWKDQIRPLLLKRFPNATPDEIKAAHAFAYGGSLVQDMGYYPFGNKYFSDLVHYVRTGDFVDALIDQSTDINEYAFALGALAHYASDVCGHPVINQVVAIEFPKLGQKFGKEVTYADDPKAHIRTEFGFDMVQVAKNRYTSDAFHDFIGFDVSKPLLERAFLQTYNMPLTDVIRNEDLAVGTFRRAISTVIPEMTRVALLNRKSEIVKDTPNFNEKKFLYHLSRASYEKQWGRGYRKPGFGTRVLAVVLKIVPKVGPFKALAFKIPTTQTEDLYIKSINKTVDNYAALLRDQKADKIELVDLDFDTGRPTKVGEYELADATYVRLLNDVNKKDPAQVSPELKHNVLGFFSDPKGLEALKRNRKNWKKTAAQLELLKSRTADFDLKIGSGDVP